MRAFNGKVDVQHVVEDSITVHNILVLVDDLELEEFFEFEKLVQLLNRLGSYVERRTYLIVGGHEGRQKDQEEEELHGRCRTTRNHVFIRNVFYILRRSLLQSS